MRVGAHIVFADESGFQLIPNVRKTWAPVGHTPLFRHRYRREKVSAISGIAVSPKRRRVRLYFQLHATNIRDAEVCDFLRHLLKHLRGRVVLIWDNASIHRGKGVRRLRHRFPRLRLEALPGYAPELNPDEGVWQYAKRELANGRPDTAGELLSAVHNTLTAVAGSPVRLKGCVRHAGLNLFHP